MKRFRVARRLAKVKNFHAVQLKLLLAQESLYGKFAPQTKLNLIRAMICLLKKPL